MYLIERFVYVDAEHNVQQLLRELGSSVFDEGLHIHVAHSTAMCAIFHQILDRRREEIGTRLIERFTQLDAEHAAHLDKLDNPLLLKSSSSGGDTGAS